MRQYRGLWRVQEKDKRPPKAWPANEFARKSTAVRGTNVTVPAGNNPSHNEESSEQTNRLGEMFNISSRDTRDISPDKAWALIKSTSSHEKCIVILLSGDLKRDRIDGMTLPLYYTHIFKFSANYQFVFCQIPTKNPLLEVFWQQNCSRNDQRSRHFGSPPITQTLYG